MHILIFLEQPRLFTILFHLFLWDSFPAMLAFGRFIGFNFGLLTITKDNNI